MKLDHAPFLSRVPTSATGHREKITAAVAIANRAQDAYADIRNDARLSAVGRAEKLREAAATWGNNGHLAQIRESTARDLAKVRSERASMVLPAPDRADLFGELQRAEVRQMLRGLTESERTQVALSGDKTVQMAIAHAPAALSGLDEQIKGRVVDTVLAATHGARLAELDVVENELVAVVVASATIGRI
jgi:hypothetical protein